MSELRFRLPRYTVRATGLLAALLVLLLAGLSVVQAAPLVPPEPFPEVLPLPNGFQPEGIATGVGQSFYVGSLVNGAIYRGSVQTGEGEILIAGQPGRVAVGLAVDPRTNYLFVAGGPTGGAYVYDAATGQEVASYQFASGGFPQTMVNDVIVTRDAAYFTDSMRPFYYRLPLASDGSLPGPSGFSEIALTGDYALVPGAFNANGIEASADGRWLLIVSSALGTLYRVDAASGYATQLDLGGANVTNGDGILLSGRTLYVVQNVNGQIAVVRLNRDWTAGTVLETIGGLDRIPATVARFGDALYVVDARFDVAPPPFVGGPPVPDLEFEVIRVVPH
jgi:hypothetical protein